MDEVLAGLIADAHEAAQDKLEAQEELTTLHKRQHEWERVQARLHKVEVWAHHIAQSERDGVLTYEDKRAVLFGLDTVVTVNKHEQKPRATIRVGDEVSSLSLLADDGLAANDMEQDTLFTSDIVSRTGSAIG